MAKRRRRPLPLAWRLLRTGISSLSKLAPGTTAQLAFALWHYPRRHKEPRREHTWRQSAMQRGFSYGEGQLMTYQWGEGSPVLLVHGWDGRGTQLGAFVKPLVAAGYRVVAFDLPAHGRSSGKRTNMLQAAAAINYIGNTIGPLSGIVAHSFGAGASAKAMADGLVTRRAILISPPASLRWLADNYYRMLGLAPRAIDRLERILNSHYGEDIWQEISPEQNLRKTNVPGLIVHDTSDHDVPLRQGEILHDAWEKSRLLKTNRLGHRRILRDQEVVRTCVDFIRSG